MASGCGDGYGQSTLLAFLACVLMLNVGMRWCAWITQQIAWFWVSICEMYRRIMSAEEQRSGWISTAPQQ